MRFDFSYLNATIIDITIAFIQTSSRSGLFLHNRATFTACQDQEGMKSR